MARLALSLDPVPELAYALDTETTGLSPTQGDRIVELSIHEIRNGRLTGRAFLSQFWPGIAVPPRASAVHGLTTAKLRGKPLFSDLIPEIEDFLGGDLNAPVFAHNAPFDRRFMEAEYARAGFAFARPMACSLRLARRVRPGQKIHTLERMANDAGLSFDGRGAHSAAADTAMLARLLGSLLWPAERAMALEEETAAAAKRAAKSKPKTKTANAPRENEPQDHPPALKPAPPKGRRGAPAFVPPPGLVPAGAGDDPRLARAVPAPDGFTPHAKGTPWTDGADHALASAFLTGAGFQEMAFEFGRTPRALALRLERLGLITDDHAYGRI